MQRTGEGRIRYVLAFQDAPWRDGEEIVVDSPHDDGDRIEMTGGDEASREIWEVGTVWESPDGEPDTLLLWKPPLRDA
jgi:hypothetical protein